MSGPRELCDGLFGPRTKKFGELRPLLYNRHGPINHDEIHSTATTGNTVPEALDSTAAFLQHLHLMMVETDWRGTF